MKVSEAVEQMTKSYLHRIIDSFTRDFPKTDEARSREIILKNVEELTDPERIERSLGLRRLSYGERVLHSCILEVLLEQPDRCATEAQIVERGTDQQEAVLRMAKRSDALRCEDSGSIEIFRAVLEVALEDESVSHEELNLLRRLRKKLGIQDKTKRILLAQLEHFPRAGNRVHTPSEFREALLELQKRGVLLYCNQLNGGLYVIPEELAPGLKDALGIELNQRGWELLLEALTKSQLATILDATGIPKSGNKQELVERVIDVGIAPSDALDTLSNDDLYEVCSSLAGAKVSGSKSAKRDRIIDYFGNLVVKEVSEEASPGETYYQYFVELATRDRENLLANKVIQKDRNMDSAFEEGARHLFEAKLGLELIHMPGSDHADGCLEFRSGGDLMLWDTKSKEDMYRFPRSHLRQFKRYIRDSGRRVSCFLVIVPEVGDGAEQTAAQLKVESKTDTDVSLISAEDLKWLAEEWSGRGGTGAFNIEVFNITGHLTRRVLEQRMKLFP